MKISSFRRTCVSVCLRFLVLAPLCLLGWMQVLPAYAWLIAHTSALILRYLFHVPLTGAAVDRAGLLNSDTAMSFTLGQRVMTMSDVGHLVANVAPYVALILATPRLTLVRRVKALILGVAILFVFHVATIVLRFEAGRATISTVIGFIAVTLPFLLWIVLAFWDTLGREGVARERVAGANANANAKHESPSDETTM